MNSVKNFIKKVLYPAALIFTVIVFFFSVLFESKILELSTSSMLKLTDLLLIFCLSLLLSWSLQIFSIKGMSYIKALMLHYAVTVFGAIIIFTLLSKKGSIGVVIIIVSAVYIPCSLIAAAVHKYTKHEEDKKSDKNKYTRQFK